MAHSARRSNHLSIGKLLITVALTALTAFTLVSFATYSTADAPSHTVWPHANPVNNLCGPAGAWIAHQGHRLLGVAVWTIALALTLQTVLAWLGKRTGLVAIRMVGVVMLAIAFAGLFAMISPGVGRASTAGNVIGQSVSYELWSRFGAVGAAVWLLLLGFIGAIVTFDKWLVIVPAWIVGVSGPVARRLGTAATSTAGGAINLGGRIGGGLAAGLSPLVKGKEPVQVRLNDVDDDPEMEEERTKSRRRKPVVEEEEDDLIKVVKGEETDEEEQPPAKPKRRRKAEPEEEEAEPKAEAMPRAKAAPDDEEDEEAQPVVEAEEADDDLPGAPQVFDPDALREKIAKLPIAFGAQNKQIATEDDLRDLQNVAEMPGYKFPGLDLLAAPEENFSATLEQYVRDQAQALEAALQQYKIDGHVVGIESGPVITLYHVSLAPGTKVSQLQTVSSDIARALKSVNIRIVSNMVGRDTVGIEVPNTTKEKVRLKELMSNSDAFAKMKLPMFLGKDASGEPLIADLAAMPHMLIAGTTGSGKSVCMNTIIMGFLYTKKPNELKLVLVDPKMVEMSQFKDIPHLMCPVVTEMSRAAAILEWACTKMDERYELLSEAGCRDIAAYNDLPWEELKARFNPQTPEEEARIPRKLPYMVFVIDELADLIITNKEVEGSIIRIAQKARAVGIHLILATQRPQANVVTGLIKSNMPCRVCFKVASGMDSRIVLDQKGGELLLGQGDMLYLSPRTSKLVRAQGTLVDDAETRAVVRFMRDVATPSFERQLMTLRKPDADEERIMQSENNSSASLAAAQEDPMFNRAVEIVLETQRGSVSLLQRRLAIGYTRASRLIDLMGIAGILGEHKGSVAREVQISIEEWEAMKKQAEADLAAMQAAGTAPQPRLFPEDEAAGPDVAAQDTAEATAVIDQSAEFNQIEEDSKDEFPDAFQDDPERSRE
ncbi:MAG: DNA translocase FtsK 4TM domain-containing protein [Phycisphaeraceae bacterium]|nr:DNA translocase FtsK 4TM domain-containing protein [Phycisphaeraceae bacterium]